MYPKLNETSFLKRKPDELIFSTVLHGSRANILMNSSAFEILELCTGHHSLDDMVHILSDRYQESEDIVRSFVTNFLTPLVKENVIHDQKTMVSAEIVKGSKEIYYPDSLVWEITTQCPLKCRHCYLTDKNGPPLSKDEINFILQLIKKTGITTVQITGGEAFTHPDIDYIIEKLAELNVVISISTSGYLLDETVLPVIRKLKNKGTVRISIDGDEAYHNALRGKPDAYKKSVEFIKMLKREGIPCQIGTVLVDQEEQMIETLAGKMKSLGVVLHSIGPVSVQGNAKGNHLKSKYNWAYLHELLSDLSKKYDSDTFKIQLPQKNTAINCGCGHKLIRIRPNLDITPCPMLDFTMGNLRETPYENIMKKNGERFHKLYSPGCQDCDNCENKNCCGDCTANAFIMKENQRQCNWYSNQSGVMKALGIQ